MYRNLLPHSLRFRCELGLFNANSLTKETISNVLAWEENIAGQGMVVNAVPGSPGQNLRLLRHCDYEVLPVSSRVLGLHEILDD